MEDLESIRSWLKLMNSRVPLSGKRVLEVGGSIPWDIVNGTFNARQWISIENPDYWHEIGKGERYAAIPANAPYAAETTHDVLYTMVEDLDESYHGKFDTIVSISCFEHINDLPRALDAMYKALVPGGILAAAIGPIWSGPQGYHLQPEWFTGPDPRDFLRAWQHLLQTPSEMHAALTPKIGREMAAKTVYMVYHSPHLNRLFCDDYLYYFTEAGFVVVEQAQHGVVQAPPDRMEPLNRRFPTVRNFQNNGMFMVLRRPA